MVIERFSGIVAKSRKKYLEKNVEMKNLEKYIDVGETKSVLAFMIQPLQYWLNFMNSESIYETIWNSILKKRNPEWSRFSHAQ